MNYFEFSVCVSLSHSGPASCFSCSVRTESKNGQTAAADQSAEELLRWRFRRGLSRLRRTPAGHHQSNNFCLSGFIAALITRRQSANCLRLHQRQRGSRTCSQILSHLSFREARVSCNRLFQGFLKTLAANLFF